LTGPDGLSRINVMTRPALERQVLALLDTTGRAFPPNDLVARVAKAQRVGDADVRAALWRLIDRKAVQLTVDLTLKAAGPTARSRRRAAASGRARRS
jgi:hypothetical protein